MNALKRLVALAWRGGLLVPIPILLISASMASDHDRTIPISIDSSGLPPRTLAPALPDRPIPAWLRTHWRIGHLPPGLGRMPEAYARAGYEVITINALRKWDIVGPTAPLYKPEEVRQADDYLPKVRCAGPWRRRESHPVHRARSGSHVQPRIRPGAPRLDQGGDRW